MTHSPVQPMERVSTGSLPPRVQILLAADSYGFESLSPFPPPSPLVPPPTGEAGGSEACVSRICLHPGEEHLRERWNHRV